MAKESPLKDWHEGSGAEFVEENGWRLPRSFGEPVREYATVRRSVGGLDLCDRALLRFTGSDRTSYLQGMLSNDVKKLAPGEGIHAAILDVQGKLQADTRLLCLAEAFLLELWEPLRDKIVEHLNRYLVADDVEIADLTGAYTVISLQGPKSNLLLREIFPNADLPIADLSHRSLRLGDSQIEAVSSSRTGEKGYDLLVPLTALGRVVAAIQERGRDYSLGWVGTETQEILRVEAGIPRYGVDMDENNLLLEIGLERAVSFQKGCYLGQEVVERIRSRGHVNKKLSGLLLQGEAPARRGSPVRADGKEIGKVTSSVFSPAQKRPVALGYLQRDYWKPGTPVTIESAGSMIPATVSSLPFYPPSQNTTGAARG
jgi:folate-binding protein YgfZ